MGLRAREAFVLVGSLGAVLLGGYYGGYVVGLGIAAVLALLSGAAIAYGASESREKRAAPANGREAPSAAAKRPLASKPKTAFEAVAAPRAAPRGFDEPPRRARFDYDRLALSGPILRALDAGQRTRGVCGSCGAHLSLSARRPVRATCPVCGHVRIVR